MKAEDTILQKRFADLQRQSETNNIYTYTGFLTPAEQALLYKSFPGISPDSYGLWGGFPDAERKILRFGSPDTLWYDEQFPLTCIVIKPVSAKFAEKLSHRDILGSIMNLGIDRSLIGDIIVKEGSCYVFCLTRIAEYIVNEITRIRHTEVRCSISDTVPEDATPNLQELSLIVPSLRIDGIVAKVFHISRSESDSLFTKGLVYANGHEIEKSAANLKAGDIISVRGYGKFKFVDVVHETKKGNLSVIVYKYV